MLKQVVMKDKKDTIISAFYIESSKVAYIKVSPCVNDNGKAVALYMQDRENAIVYFVSSDDNFIKKFVDLFNESNSANEIEINLN